MTTVVTPLVGSGSAIVGSNGRATVRIGADKPFLQYHITYVSVQNDGAQNCTASIYRGTPGPTSLVESSPSGNEDITDTRFDLKSGEFITIEWSGATPGSRCLTVFQGTQEYGG